MDNITILINDHKKFLMTMGLIISMSCTDSKWLNIKSLLSPKYKFNITNPNSFLYSLIELTEFKLVKTLKNKNKTYYYIEYIFPELEHAACVEFLLSYKEAYKINSDMTMDMLNAKHRFSHLKERKKFYGVITLSKSEHSDTIKECD